MLLTDVQGPWLKLKLSLDPQTGADLVHYLNDETGTALGSLRAAAGHPRPYGVKRFVLGNELWVNYQSADLSLEQAKRQYVRFARVMKAADPSVKIGIALIDYSYPPEFLRPKVVEQYGKWLTYNQDILGDAVDESGAALGRVADVIDFVTFHVYSGVGDNCDKALPLDDRQWRFVMSQAFLKEKNAAAARHRQAAGNAKLELVVDEYSGPLTSLGGALYDADYLLYLLRNDYAAASNWALVRMMPGQGELFASLLVKTEKGATSYVRRPNFYAQRMLAECLSGSLVRTEVLADTFTAEALETAYFAWPKQTGVPSLEAVASLDGDRLCLVILNRDVEKTMKTALTLGAFAAGSEAKVRTLWGDSLNTTNDQNSEAVQVEESTLSGEAAAELTLKAHSLTTVSFERLR